MTRTRRIKVILQVSAHTLFAFPVLVFPPPLPPTVLSVIFDHHALYCLDMFYERSSTLENEFAIELVADWENILGHLLEAITGI